MAAFMCKSRGIFSQCRRLLHLTVPKNEKKAPDQWDLMTGLELWEAVQHKKGSWDPFLQEPIQRGPGTKDCPNVIYSPYHNRIVGCICDEDTKTVKWMYLHEGFPKRCYCGHWFVLERVPLPEDLYEDPTS